MGIMTNRDKLVAALCGGAAALVLAVGESFGSAAAIAATAPMVSVPAPKPPPAPGGALPVHPAGGGGCIIGLNCGCIPHRTCPGSHARPGTVNDHQHPPPAPQTP